MRSAIEELAENKCKIEKVSSVYETLPFGNIKQDNFYNAVVKLSTSISQFSLFENMKNIERVLGRTKKEQWGPREIDLDLLFFNDISYTSKDLVIPHKGILKRDFVLVPLLEIEPELAHPVTKVKLKDIVVSPADKTIKKKLDIILYPIEV